MILFSILRTALREYEEGWHKFQVWVHLGRAAEAARPRATAAITQHPLTAVVQ